MFSELAEVSFHCVVLGLTLLTLVKKNKQISKQELCAEQEYFSAVSLGCLLFPFFLQAS